jgi:hypothetical protein
MKINLGEILIAQRWFNIFWIIQLVGFLALLFGGFIFFPPTNPYLPVFLSALSILTFSWLGVAIAWEKLIRILKKI